MAQLMLTARDITCTVLFVTPFTRDLARFLGMFEDEYNKDLGELAEIIKSKVESIFAYKGLQVQTLLLEGDPVRVICELAQKEAYTEIVIGSRGYTGIKGAICGNFSREVAKKATCSVKIIL